MKKKSQYSIGIDLGGTKIACGLVSKNGELLKLIKASTKIKDDKQKKPTRSPGKSIKSLLDKINDSILSLIKDHNLNLKEIKGIGLASAGPLNVEKGILINPANFTGWKIVPIISLLKKRLQSSKINLPIFFQNDAIGAALGEGWIGRAKNLKSFALITIGTGIGTGVILNNKPSHTKGMGSEWGHMVIDSSSIKSLDNFLNNSVEGIASGTALLERARQLGFKGESTYELVEIVRNKKTKYSHLFQNQSKALAILCYNLSMGYNLEKIILSGGLIEARDLFYDDLKSLYHSYITKRNKYFKCPIVISKLGKNAGVIGAARLSWL